MSPNTSRFTRLTQYWVSHGDEGLLDAVRKGRREEFEDFGWDKEMPDPGSEATFAGSRIEPGAAGQNAGQGALQEFYKTLIGLRRGVRSLFSL